MSLESIVQRRPPYNDLPSRSQGHAIILISCLSLADCPARGQQPYIPWASGLQMGADALRVQTTQSINLDRRLTRRRLRRLPDPPAASRTRRKVRPGPSTMIRKPFDGFATRLYEAYFGEKEQEDEEEASHRPGVEIPFDSPPFPFADYIGPYIGYRDTSAYPLMDAIYHGPMRTGGRKAVSKSTDGPPLRITPVLPGTRISPCPTAIIPNHIELSQAVLIFERVTDSVQTDHPDWGFKFTNLYGTDYRFTTAKGYFSDQLLKHNRLYGYDPLQMYVDYYIPWIPEGTIIRAGRFISPMDIEAQLSPDNYLYTHSLMNTYDPFTFTGIQFSTRLAVSGMFWAACTLAATWPPGRRLHSRMVC